MPRLLVRGDLAAHVDGRRQPRHRLRGESARAIHRRQRRRDVLIAGPHLRFQRVKTLVLKCAPPWSARPQIGRIRRKPLRLARRRPLAGRLGDLAPGSGRLLEGHGRLDDWRLILRREIAAAQAKAQSKPQHPRPKRTHFAAPRAAFSSFSSFTRTTSPSRIDCHGDLTTRSRAVTPVEISSVVPRSRAIVIVLTRTRF